MSTPTSDFPDFTDPFEEDWDDDVVYPQHEDMMRLIAETEGVDAEQEEVVEEPEDTTGTVDMA